MPPAAQVLQHAARFSPCPRFAKNAVAEYYNRIRTEDQTGFASLGRFFCLQTGYADGIRGRRFMAFPGRFLYTARIDMKPHPQPVKNFMPARRSGGQDPDGSSLDSPLCMPAFPHGFRQNPNCIASWSERGVPCVDPIVPKAELPKVVSGSPK
jgi:hypothetical protein